MTAQSLAPTSTRRVLLVEDEPEQAQLLKRWIEHDLGFDVEVVNDGLSAIELVSCSRYDAVVTDLRLPGSDGLEVLARSKELYPHRPALLITASTQRDVVLEALRRKADDFLAKPLQRDDAVGRIGELTRESRQKLKSGLFGRPARKTVLAISAHPDDAEIGCGGTLLKHRRTGDRVVLLILTDGGLGGCVEARQLEAEAAAQQLGAEVVFAGLKDGQMGEGYQTISPIEKVIARVRPDIVYSHSQHDTHQDHRSAARATRVAARKVRSLYCYQSPSSTVEFRPTKFINISEELDGKLELIGAFGTQTDVRSYLNADVIRANATYWGRHAGFVPVEPLEVVRENSGI